jgi:predicted Zn-dependent peptidase
MPFHHQTLANGLTILAETNPSALATAVGFFVRTGARDETDGESGVSHFLEHMAFKGTPRRTTLDVNRDFDRIGADNNAFTSEENTVYHATVLPEYLPQAVDILADILRPSLRQEDFDTEKGVIQDEIVRYDVQPAWAAYDNARRIYFGSHPLSHSILGSKESIDALTRDQMVAYFNRRYVAPNMIVAAAGRLDWNDFTAMIDKYCSGWPNGSSTRTGLTQATGAGGTHVITRANTAQEYVLLTAPAPAADADLRYAAAVLSVAVGDYTGSRLYWALVDPGLADSADMGNSEYQAAGTFMVTFSCLPEATASNLAIVRDLLDEVQRNGITDDELAQAKSKLASREVRAAERTIRRMLTIGRDWTNLGTFRTLDDELSGIETVSLRDIRALLEQFPLIRLTTVALGPLNSLE